MGNQKFTFSTALLTFLLLVQQVKSVVYPSIHWSPKNPIFLQNENTRTITVDAMSKIKIVCPNPSTVMTKVQDNTPKEWLYENLWIVSRESYKTCNTTISSRNRILLTCDTPLKLKYYTVVFQQYSATAQGLEFALGKEYYFIATSDGTKASLDDVKGGNCARGSMKLTFYVCKNLGDPRCLPPTRPPTPPPTTTVTPYKNTKQKQQQQTAQPTIKTQSIAGKTTATTTDENVGLQSDDPGPTLLPSLQTVITTLKPEVTSEVQPEVRMYRQEPCSHDHGSKPSWNVIIPLLIIIVLLIATNIFFVYRLKQLYPKYTINEKDDMETKRERSTGILESFKLKRSQLRRDSRSQPSPENV